MQHPLDAFYTNVGTISATLLGLLFIAVTQKSNEIKKNTFFNVQMLAAFGLYLVLIICSLLYLASQKPLSLSSVIYGQTLFILVIQIATIISSPKGTRFEHLYESIPVFLSLPFMFVYWIIPDSRDSVLLPMFIVLDISWSLLIIGMKLLPVSTKKKNKISPKGHENSKNNQHSF